MVNTWIIPKTLNKKEALNLKVFQRAVATVHLKKSVILTRGSPRIPTVPYGAKEDSKDSVGYFLLKPEKQCRCQREDCKRKLQPYCGKCDKTFCQAWLEPFHKD
ncbi:hypothetical protein TNCV_2627451 [Trichonephila clavipes]|uniref:Uncharacterized protein n=1 Tax=Trichonephila clavipes TaxID=2585209 RepID=A0A8X6W7I8_TRICX|nr:hypothetical protein TNCV_2627451 [Trichonephila clavipes]